MSSSPLDRLRDTLARLETLLPAGPAPAPAAEEDWLGIVGDRLAPSGARREALGRLASRLRTEPELGEIILAVLGDPDESLVVEAIRSSPPFDPRVRLRLHQLLDDPRPTIRIESASVLARRMDTAVAPTLLTWFRCDDPERRRAAIAGMACVLKPEASIRLFEEELGQDGLDDLDRSALADALVEARRRAEGRRKAFGGEDDE